jgi:hypothetical protein
LRLIQIALWQSNNFYQYYGANWTVTGSGRNADFTWKTNGKGWTILQFWVPSTGIGSGLLNIAEGGQSAPDLYETTVTSLKDGSYSKASVAEWPFPTPIVAKPGAINSVKDSANLPPTTGAAFFKEPTDGINYQACSWDFEYQPLLLLLPPGKLCLPDMPEPGCDKPFVLKPPLKKPD